jgi:hypothetical protein
MSKGFHSSGDIVQQQADGSGAMKTVTSMLFAFCMSNLVGCVAETSPPPTGNSAEMQALLEEFPEATQVDDHSISWYDGKVVLELQEDDAGELSAEDQGFEPRAVVHGCEEGWYCVYSHLNWNVNAITPPQPRRLRFSDCTRNDLSNFGFRDQTTSWVNNGPHTVQVKNDLTLQPDQVLWTMGPHSSSSNVGAAANDKADYFQCL